MWLILSAMSPAAEMEPADESDTSPIGLLSHDPLRLVFARLPLRDALACRPVCRLFSDALAPPTPPLAQLRLLALRSRAPVLYALDPASSRWLRLPLSFLPFPSLSALTASRSLLFLRASADGSDVLKSLIVCNPLTRAYRVLPQLGSAWPRHGELLGAPGGAALVLTETAAFSCAPGAKAWVKTPHDLPSRPRSPILVNATIYTLCDAGSPWWSRWKLFACPLCGLGRGGWAQLERPEWGDVLDILYRPRLASSATAGRLLLIGGLRTSYSMDAPCSTVVILRLDVETMGWDEAGRMPSEMYESFCSGGVGDDKVKVSGGDGMLWFSGKNARAKLAMWEEEEEGGGRWKWVDGVPGDDDGVLTGFVFDAGINDVP